MKVDLRKKYNEYNERYFNNELPELEAGKVDIEWSSRMTASAGMMVLRQSYCGKVADRKIKISTHYAERYPEDVDNVIIHEMIHILHPHDNHNEPFQQKADEINRKAEQLGEAIKITVHASDSAKAPKWSYICDSCGRDHTRQRRAKNGGTGYRCGKCKGKLTERKNY